MDRINDYNGFYCLISSGVNLVSPALKTDWEFFAERTDLKRHKSVVLSNMQSRTLITTSDFVFKFGNRGLQRVET